MGDGRRATVTRTTIDNSMGMLYKRVKELTRTQPHVRQPQQQQLQPNYGRQEGNAQAMVVGKLKLAGATSPANVRNN